MYFRVVVDQYAFGQFQFQQAGGQVETCQCGAQLADKAGGDQLSRRDVDADDDLTEYARFPLTCLVADLIEYPIAQFNDHATIFRYRDETVRRDGAQHSTVPAQQGFGFFEFSATAIRDGLIV